MSFSRPSLPRDGVRLYFGSTRANAVLGGSGGDVYVSTRRKAGTPPRIEMRPPAA